MLLRAVIREDMSMSMVDELVKDITRAVEYLDTHFTVHVHDKPEGQTVEVMPLDVTVQWSSLFPSSLPVNLGCACMSVIRLTCLQGVIDRPGSQTRLFATLSCLSS